MSATHELEPVVPAGAETGEGPTWSERERALLWVDIPAGRVHRYDPASGRSETMEVGRPVGVVVERSAGGYLVGLPEGLAAVEGFGATVEPSLVCPIERNLETRLNDGKCDPRGRLWVGSMSTRDEPAAGTLYRVDAGLVATPVLTGVTISNGLGWSPDATRMYFIDTGAHGLDVLDYDLETGAAEHRRRLVDVPPELGLADGLAVDAEGGIWVALWGGAALHRYSAAGELDEVVPFPVSQVSSCCFGGASLDELYVTTAGIGVPEGERQGGLAGGLFRLRPGVRGLPTTPFAG